MVQVSTYQYMPVRTDLGITDVSTYCLVPICGFLYGLVSTSVRTGSYQYIPSCTTLYQGYRIPDVRLSGASAWQLDISHHGSEDLVPTPVDNVFKPMAMDNSDLTVASLLTVSL